MHTVLEIKPSEILINGEVLLPRQALIKRQIISILAKQYFEDCLKNTETPKAFTPKDIAHNLNRTEWDAVYQMNRHIRNISKEIANRLGKAKDDFKDEVIEILTKGSQKTFRLNPRKVRVMISPFHKADGHA
ncbi:MAG: hypothetical protein K2Q34_08070 [Alphaproteobacteria bacterium]|nr:hypothetical protein [Alphaproteobacteria bacterium]